MRGLTVLLASPDADRLRSALGLVAAQAALGGPSRLFLDGAAVPLLSSPAPADDDARYAGAGLPTRAELIDTALALGASITLCQSGLALAGIDAATIDPRFATGGLTGLLATLGDDRLVTF